MALAVWSGIHRPPGITKDTIYARIADKPMPADPVGRLWKLQVSEIVEWVHSSGAAQPSRDDAETPCEQPQSVSGHAYRVRCIRGERVEGDSR